MNETIKKRLRLLDDYKNNKLPLEQLLEGFAKTGLSPGLAFGLVNDDFGNWALAFDGMQNVPEIPGEPSFIDTHFLIDKHKWHKTIRDAVIHCFDEPPGDEENKV